MIGDETNRSKIVASCGWAFRGERKFNESEPEQDTKEVLLRTFADAIAKEGPNMRFI